ncbi:hypothetical protein Droror1_Dr00006757 [Drosera rotundifolia]
MAEKSFNLEDIKNEAVDLENIPIEEVFEQLKCSRDGLTTTEGENRLQIFGFNKLEEKKVKGMGWGWAGVIWLYSIIFYLPLDLLKFAIRYVLSGQAWQNLYENKVCSYPLLLRELHTLKGHVESVVKLKGLDIDTIQQHYTV